MPNMTKKHFVWLAKEVAPNIRPDKIAEFVATVATFSGNPNFDEDKFIDALESASLDERSQNDLGPEDYKW